MYFTIHIVVKNFVILEYNQFFGNYYSIINIVITSIDSNNFKIGVNNIVLISWEIISKNLETIIDYFNYITDL